MRLERGQHLVAKRDVSRPPALRRGDDCRRRGFCPSCIGRRMSDFAAQLVDRVIPRVPIRRWVLTVPHRLRARMMFDPALTSAVLRELIRAISSWLRQRARRQGVVGASKTGAVTVIQRFNSALGANPHFPPCSWTGSTHFPSAERPRSIRRPPLPTRTSRQPCSVGWSAASRIPSRARPVRGAAGASSARDHLRGCGSRPAG
jgi:hypothetical protein